MLRCVTIPVFPRSIRAPVWWARRGHAEHITAGFDGAQTGAAQQRTNQAMNEFVHSNTFILLFACVVWSSAYLASDLPAAAPESREPDSPRVRVKHGNPTDLGHCINSLLRERTTTPGLHAVRSQPSDCPVPAAVIPRYSRMPQ